MDSRKLVWYSPSLHEYHLFLSVTISLWYMGLGPNWYQIENKTCYIPKSMLTGLKVSSLACKRVFWRPEHNKNINKGDPMELNFEDLEMQKWNTLTDRAQRVDEKNGAICLVIMFTLRVTVIKMSQMAHFLHSLLMTAKK